LETVDRRSLFEAETPQLIRRALLLKAYRENRKSFLATDEASLVESLGGRVAVVPHSSWNVKVTTPEDLRLAEAYLLLSRAGAGFKPAPAIPVTVGFGRDTHRLLEGRPFYLGGVRIPFEKGPLGHSDGDALLHAIADALLGATGLGDLGEWFPDTSRRFKNIRSARIVREILEAVREKGWEPARVDTVTLLERPKLGSFKEKIRREIARLLGIPRESVSIKAKTQEGLGPEGEGLAVTSEALVLLRK